MTGFDWHPGSLLELSGSYWKTCALHTGVKLDVFTAIGTRRCSREDLGRLIQADPEGLERLLNALTAMGLLDKTAGAYANSEAALKFLSKDSPGYIGFMILHHHHLMDSWHRMDAAIREGRPVRTRASFADPDRREAFLMGMFNSAMAVAPKLVPVIDLTGCTKLLDFGGGPGTFAIHFCLAHPELSASVYDLETTRPFAEKTVARFGLAHRVDFVSGNFNEEAFPRPGAYDAAFLSHILHGEGPDEALDIIRKAVSALKPGSPIVIHEFILDDDKSGPLFPALFSINMYLGTEKGRSYSEKELADMFRACGVTDIRRLAFDSPSHSGLIQGRVG